MYINKDLKIKKDDQLTAALNIQLSRINESMMPLKKKWAESYMNYNLVTVASYDWRFKQYEKVGQKKADNKDSKDEFYTKEQKYGKYIVSTLARQKCDQYIQEYTSRDTTVSSKYTQQATSEYLSKKMTQLFSSSAFNGAKAKAISDAVVKGTGVVRNRVRMSKKNKAIHSIEYVDIEDVYIDPCTSHVNEMFISTPYTDLDIIRMLPDLEKYLPNLYQNDPTLVRIDSQKSKKELLQQQDLHLYRIGERMIDIHEIYDSNRVMGAAIGKPCLVNISDRWYTPSFLNDINTYYGNYNKYNGKYRINEYYKLVGKPRYIMYVGQYILLDLDYIPEGTMEDILCFFYASKLPKDTVFGKSLIELIKTDFDYLNFVETKIKIGIQEATATILMLNDKFLSNEHKGKPIELEEITTVHIDTSTLSPNESGGGIGMPIQLLNIVNPNLPVLMNERQSRLNTINLILPSTSQLNAQFDKEQSALAYHSRDSDINHFLLANATSLSQFSHTVAICIINNLLSQGDNIVQDQKEGNPKLLIVRQTQNEIESAKQMIAELYSQRYMEQVEQLKTKIQESQEFQQKAGELSTNLGQLAQQKYSEAEPEMQKSIPFGAQQEQARNFEQKVNEDTYTEIENLLNQFLQEAITKSGLKPMNDNNIYMAVDEMLDEIEEKQLLFEFKFDKSKEEIRKNIIDILSIPKIFPTAQLAIKANVLLSAYLATYGMDADDSIDQEAPFGAEAQIALSKKQTVYLDPTNSPVAFFESFAKDNNIPIETLTDIEHPAYAALAKRLSLEQKYRVNLDKLATAKDALELKAKESQVPTGQQATTSALTTESDAGA
jgi:uncharacterized membrane-anchored protein YjiN (DUF445 family)